MIKYILLLFFITNTLSQTGECYFPPAAPNSTCASFSINTGNCISCDPGYGFLNGNCYPPCPSNYTQLMPSYCLSNATIAANTSFNLCPTTTTQILGTNQCIPTNSTCTCGPSCPPGYTNLGCTCNYVGTSVVATTDDGTTSTMFKFWTAFLACGIALFLGFIAYKIWLRNRQESTKQASTQGVEYKEMVTQRA